MRKFNDLTGKKAGKWKILKRVSLPGAHEVTYKCKCECGKVANVLASALICKGKVVTGGCNPCARRGKGEFFGWEKEKLTWNNIHKRCYDPKNPGFKYYGARGVTVCKRWRDSFWNFAKDIGKIGPGESLDRIDSAGIYEPSNCRVILRKEQNWNKRTTVWVTLEGKKRQLGKWLKIYKTPWGTYYKRRDRGLSIEEAITNPKTYIGKWLHLKGA